MNKVVFLNGPPRCGKDTIANWFAAKHGFKHTKMATALKTATNHLIGFSKAESEAWDKVKDEKSDLFFGVSPREFYIKLSEEFMKPNFGREVFGHIWCRENIAHSLIHSENSNVYIVSDCGFIEEMRPIIKNIKPENCILIHVCRDGCTFNNDSRSYIVNPDIETLTITNVEDAVGFAVTDIENQLKQRNII